MSQQKQQITRRRNVRRRAPASKLDRARFWVRRHWLGTGLTVAVVAALGILLASHTPGGSGANATASHTGTTGATTYAPPASLTLSKADEGSSMGVSTAPVTVINYSDFMCPYCTQFVNTVQTQFIKDYVTTGKVRYVARMVAFLTPASQTAAEAAYCAEDQGKFWPYHDLLYAQRGLTADGVFTPDRLKEYASQLGLNTGQFNSCLDNHKHAADVQAATNAAVGLGVNGTPTIYVNGQPLVGGMPYDSYRQAIDAALAHS